MDWFAATLLATLAYGVLQAIQRVASAQGLPARRLLAGSACTVALLAAGFATLGGDWSGVSGRLLALAALNALLFTAGTLALLGALQRASAATVLPVAKLDGVVVVLIGLLALGERPTPAQAAGIALGLAAVAALTWPRRGAAAGGRGAGAAPALAATAAACYAASMSVGKLASLAGPKLGFMAVSYALTALAALALRSRAPPPCPALRRRARLTGALLGVANFAGYLALLHAFAAGPMALIQPLFASSTGLAVLLAARVLGERLAAREGVALALSLAAAIVLGASR